MTTFPTSGDFPNITELVAHRQPMLLIDQVLAAEGPWIKVAARVDPQAWYADAQGDMPAWVGVELMAQTIAAWAGLQGWSQGTPPKQGFLLGTRNYSCRPPQFAAGSELHITASEAFREANGLAAFDCTIEVDGETLAEAALKVFEPADFEAFMEQQA